MPIKKRTYNTRRIKRDYSYDIQEIAELFDLHKTSIRNWIKQGLILIDKSRPHMVHGSDLIAFLKERQSKRKYPCKLNEFFCLKCHVPRPPWEGQIDIKITTETKLLLIGVCPLCNTSIFKIGSVKKIPEYTKTFDVQKIQERHIVARTNPVFKCHLERTIKS